MIIIKCYIMSFQVGALIVQGQSVVSTGYNHMVGESEIFPWSRTGDWIDTKYPYGTINRTREQQFLLLGGLRDIQQ